MVERTDPRRRIARLRLRNQRLAESPPGAAPLRRAAEVVAWMGAVQAQEYPYARWSVGQRANGVLDEAAVEAALARGDIVRTHVMRDTWHFVTRSDARWLLRLTGPRIQARNATQYRKLGLDSAQLAKTDALLADVLCGGVQLTRRSLAGELAQRGLVAEGSRLGYILMHAELEEVICSGARQGKQQTYALFDDRVPPAASFDRDRALAEAVRRFFTSHGPATEADYRWWSGLTGALVKRGIAAAGAALARVEVDGRAYWRGAGAEPPPPVAGGPTAWLLQSFDEYVVAHPDSRDVLDPAGLVRYVGQRASRFLSVVLVDGRVAGFWGRTDRAAAVVVDVHLAATPTRAERAAIERAAEAYGRFVGRTTVVTVTETV